MNLLHTAEVLSIGALLLCAVATAVAIIGGLIIKARKCCSGGSCGCKGGH